MQGENQTEPSESDIAQVTRLFVQLGAENKSAEVMAKQLLKRARQLSLERGISFVEATEKLLKQVIEARSGGESPMNSDLST